MNLADIRRIRELSESLLLLDQCNSALENLLSKEGNPNIIIEVDDYLPFGYSDDRDLDRIQIKIPMVISDALIGFLHQECAAGISKQKDELRTIFGTLKNTPQ